MDADGYAYDLENLPFDTRSMIEHLRQYAFEHQDDKYVDIEAACEVVFKRTMDTLEFRSTIPYNIP